MDNDYGVVIVPCFGEVQIRSRGWFIVLLTIGLLTIIGLFPSPVADKYNRLFADTRITCPPQPTADVLKIESHESSTTLDIDNGKLRLTFKKNNESKLPVEVVVDGRTIVADPGQSQVAQAE